MRSGRIKSPQLARCCFIFNFQLSIMKNRTFDYTKIEICRNCRGAGFVVGGYNAQVAPVCPVCEGSGRVAKHVKGTITIEPYQ